MKANIKLVLAVMITVMAFGFVLFVPMGDRELKAIGTAPGIILTNVAVINWMSGSSNMTTNVSNVSAAVGTNYGVTWIGTASNDIVFPGSLVFNNTFLSNDGNSSAEFIVTFNSNLPNNASKVWSAEFTNVTDGGGVGGQLSMLISPAGGKNIKFLVLIPADETNGAFTIYQCLASNSNAVAEIGNAATNYVGFNTTAYGGSMGMFGAGPGNTILTNPQTQFTNWTLTVGVADILLVKTAVISNAGPFAAETTIPYPGAWVTFKLSYTNRGLAMGTNVTIVDTMPTNFLTFVTGTLKKGTYADDWAAAATALSDAADADEGAYTNDDRLFFNPGGSAPGTPGTIGSTTNAAFFYRTTLN